MLEQAGWGFRSKSRCIWKYLCGDLEVVLEVGISTRKSETNYSLMVGGCWGREKIFWDTSSRK
jgi:hypothetical protein